MNDHHENEPNPNKDPSLRFLEKLRTIRTELRYFEDAVVVEHRDDFVRAARSENPDPDTCKALLRQYNDAAEEGADWIFDAGAHLGLRIAQADVWLEAGYPLDCLVQLELDIDDGAWDNPAFRVEEQQFAAITSELRSTLFGSSSETE